MNRLGNMAAGSVTAGPAIASRATKAVNPTAGTWAPPRTVYVKASPAPLTFAERRAVLHALKRHCKVDFFQKVPNHPSSFLSMVESPEAAESLIANSPLKYQLAMDTAVPRPGSAIPDEPANAEGPRTNDQAAPLEATPILPEETKSFVIHVFPRALNKNSTYLAEDAPLYRAWPTWPDTTSFMAKNLRRSIPEGEMRDALADWETCGQLAEDGNEKERSGGGSLRRERAIRDKRAQHRQRRRDDKMGLSWLFRNT